jgi:L-fuconolactonase
VTAERPPRVDAHQHVWDLTVRDQPWTARNPVLQRSFALGEVVPSLDAHDIDTTVVLQTVTVAEETPELLALAADERRIAGVVGWTDLTGDDVDGVLVYLRSLPGGDRLVGIRHQVQDEPDAEWLCRSDVRRGLKSVASAGLVYDLVVIPEQLPAVLDTVRAVPELRFVLDHGGKPRIAAGAVEPWRSQIADLAREENVAVKLSGLTTEAGASWTLDDLRPFAGAMLDSYGPDRVMFGSDWPTCLEFASYETVFSAATTFTAGLDPAERDAVFGVTATRWYGLGQR